MRSCIPDIMNALFSPRVSRRRYRVLSVFVCERRKVVPFLGVGLDEPSVSTFDAEVVAEFVGGEGFDQGRDVDSFLFQRGKEGGEG